MPGGVVRELEPQRLSDLLWAPPQIQPALDLLAQDLVDNNPLVRGQVFRGQARCGGGRRGLIVRRGPRAGDDRAPESPPCLRPRPRTDPITPTNTSRCCDVRWNPPSPSGANSGGHTHPGLHGGRDRAWRAIAACISPVRPTWAEWLILRRMVMSSGARSRPRTPPRTPPRLVGSMRVAPYARGSPARARSAPPMIVVLGMWNPPGSR